MAVDTKQIRLSVQYGVMSDESGIFCRMDVKVTNFDKVSGKLHVMKSSGALVEFSKRRTHYFCPQKMEDYSV